MAASLILLACISASAGDVTPGVSYNFDIRPIFSEHCFRCHGPDAGARKASLRLDEVASATTALPTGAVAMVPGKPDASALIRRILAEDLNDRMPPPEHGRALTPGQIETLRQWIAEGAHYEMHWAYVAPVRPSLPAVRDTSWPRNAIDFFVLARLEAEGMPPAPEADAYTLIRRLSFDLTGLPPTMEEADAFANDTRPDRVAWAVDRLLASPAYGEHVGRRWLDLARYADSNGYHVDTKRSMWPYRDWVIGAFNRNMPFDAFTIEQIAGDLVPDATLDQRIATGFHRNTMFNEEGGIDQEEFRTKAVVNRVDTTMNVWMGTTMGCAQCHDHKYDPFTQEEFYQLYAFFNNVPELGGGTGQSMAPLVSLPLDETQQAERESLDSVIADLERRQEAFDSRLRAELAGWAKRAKSDVDAWTLLTPTDIASASGSIFEVMEDGSVFVSGEVPDPYVDTYTVEATSPVRRITALAIEVMPDARLPAGGPGRAEDGGFRITHVEAGPGNGDAWKPGGARAVYDDSDHGPEHAIDEDQGHKSGWSTGKRAGKGDSLIVTLVDAPDLADGIALRIALTQGLAKHTLGRFRIWVTGTPDVATLAPPHLNDALRLADMERSDAQRDALLEYYRTRQTERYELRLAELRAKVAALEKSAPTSLVMAEMETPRESHVLVRGDFLSPGDPVSPGTPRALHALEVRGTRPNRLDLAHWLVDARNPLVARVTVNRLWAMVFGRGIVDTLDDFGTRGALPTHPELLDYLAVEFMERGWDVKSMLRLIVTSATYGQSSTVGADAYTHDPYNTLLARGPRFRLDAESIRDNALAVSGLLVARIGGPPAHPYQPPGLYEEKIQTGYDVGEWPTVTGDDLYRRGVYTFRRRSVPYPTFQTFDAPSFEYCTANRPRTNTPLQALTTMNDPQFVEAARVLAERVLQSKSTMDERLVEAVRLCLTRPPAPRELEYLRGLCERQMRRFAADPDAAGKLVHHGRSPVAFEVSPTELAAWTVIANVVLNLDETVTKG